MYKVLIAENEEETIEAVRGVVNDKIKDAKIVAVARTGSEAVIETINNDPDLLIIGVRIGGMNGLEAIKQIRDFNKTIRIIIISSYDYFDFARQAMLLNVNDYLLKPLKVEELSSSIRREFDFIKEENERLKKFRKEEHLLYDALRFVEASFLYSILYNEKYFYDMNRYCELLNIEDTGYIMYIELPPLFLSGSSQADKINERLHRRIKTILSAKAKCAVGATVMNRVMVYISSEPSKSAKEEQIEAIKLGKQVINGIKDTFGIDVSIGIGGIKSKDSLHESYYEAIRCSRFKTEGPIIHTKEVRYNSPMLYDYTVEMKRLVDSIGYNKQEAIDCFLNIIDLLRPLSTSERMFKLIEVLILVEFEMRRDGKFQESPFNYLREYKILEEYTVEEQEAWAWRRFYSALKSTRVDKGDRKSNVINVAIEYIQRHYNEEITLNQISEYVNLSPQHFSKIFKESTNYKFVDWVNNLRISKAKELMNGSTLTIKEICFQVGYQDPNYFSRIFKKYVGLTPTEYVKERED